MVWVPLDFANLVGNYQLNDSSFTIIVNDRLSNRLDNSANINTKNASELNTETNTIENSNNWGLQGAIAPPCGGWDLNPRTPFGTGS